MPNPQVSTVLGEERAYRPFPRAPVPTVASASASLRMFFLDETEHLPTKSKSQRRYALIVGLSSVE
jgi:hypothetical protein